MKKQTHNYNFIFNLNDKVKVKDLNIKGRICGIYIGRNIIEYHVRYFSAGKAETSYFEPDELELITNEAIGLGFKKE